MSSVSQFKQDFEVWAWRMRHLEDCPESEVEEIRESIRNDWSDPEKKAGWVKQVADEAAFSRELQQKARDAVTRIRESRCEDL